MVPSYAVKGYRELIVEVNDVYHHELIVEYYIDLSTIGCVVLIQLILPWFMNEVVCQCLYDCQLSSFEDESSKQRHDSSINL